MAKQIKMLFGVNTPAGGLWKIVLHEGSDLPQTGEGDILLNFGTPLVSPEWLKLET